MSPRLSRDRMLDAIEAQAGLVRFALTGLGGGGEPDLGARVPTCPGWTVHDLVTHLGAANWWGGANVERADPSDRARGLRRIQDSAPPAEAGPVALAAWYAELAEGARRTYAGTDPETPVWTFAGPGQAGYWLRRQLHETVIHRWDLENALAGPAATTPVTEDVAVDTVDEFCTAMRPLVAGAAPLPVTIRLRAVPEAPTRLATGAEPVGSSALGGLEWELADGVPAGEVEVAGRPEALALLVWGRIGADEPGLEISGDRAGLDAAVAAGFAV